MFYLVNEKADVKYRIVSDQHPVVQMHLRESDTGWDAESIIKWIWGIEKKAESPFDLIEKGDLVGLDYTNYPFSEDKYTIRFVDDLTFKGIHYNEDVIVAIYKPDSKGNYIKVWEKEKYGNSN